MRQPGFRSFVQWILSSCVSSADVDSDKKEPIKNPAEPNPPVIKFDINARADRWAPEKKYPPMEPQQLAKLEMTFLRCPYPDIFVREELAYRLNLHESQVQSWFIHRRSVNRKR